MNTLKENILPQKLNLEMVAAELELSHLSPSSQIDTILYHHREGTLTLKSRVPIDCNAQEVSQGLEECYQSNGDLVLFSCGESRWIKTADEPTILGSAFRLKASHIITMTFIFEETEYYSLDDPGMHPESLSYSFEDIYVEKADLNVFLEKGAEEIPAYANPASEHFAPELALAVKLHRALRIENEGRPNLNMEANVDIWLRKNIPGGSVSDSQLKRLKAIIGNGKKIYPNQNKL